MMTIAETLRAARQRLQTASPAADNKTAALEAEVLLGFCLNQSRAKLLADAGGELSPAQADAYEKLIARRAAGEPIAYITGEQEFWSQPLHITLAVLIPRADSELLAELCIAEAGARAMNILELGTGSGAIALALAYELPRCKIIATDFSAAALGVARENARRLGRRHPEKQADFARVEFRRGNWFDAFGADEKFHIIIANPPYVAADDAHLQRGDARFEPRAALVAADNGLADLKLIIRRAPKYLSAGGMLLVEHGAMQAAAVRELFVAAGYENIRTRRDLAGRERVTGGKI